MDFHPPSFNSLILTNNGTVNWTANLAGSSSPQIFNYGLWDAKANNTFNGGTGNTIFNNYGTFRKSGGTTFDPGSQTFLNSQVIFNSSGTVEALAGELALSTGTGTGTFNTGGFNTTNSAIFFSGYTLGGNPTFSGLGSIEGSLSGSNAIVHGAEYFKSGTLMGSMTWAADNTMNLVAGGFSSPSFYSLILTNNGTVNWTASLDGSSSPQIFNYGLWDSKTNNTFTGGSGGALFNNYGTFRKSGGATFDPGSQTFLNSQVIFNSSGTVEALTGELALSTGTGTGTFNTGGLNTTNSAIFFSGYNLAGNPTFSGLGTIEGSLNGSNAIVHGAEYFKTGTLMGSMTWAADNTMNLVAGGFSAPLFYSLILTNNGTVNWTANLDGSLSPQIFNYGLWDSKTNNTFTGGSGGALFNNYGTFRKSGGRTFNPGSQTFLNSQVTFNNPGLTDVRVGEISFGGTCSLNGGTLSCSLNSLNNFGQIFFSGSVTLTGTLTVNLTNGYSPALSNSFPLLLYGSASGTFATRNLPHLSPPLAWKTDYGTNAFTLSVVTMPPLQLIPAFGPGNQTNHAFSWQGLDGVTYQVQSTTNLAPANWLNLGSPINGTNGPATMSDAFATDPQKFYRIIVLP